MSGKVGAERAIRYLQRSGIDEGSGTSQVRTWQGFRALWRAAALCGRAAAELAAGLTIKAEVSELAAGLNMRAEGSELAAGLNMRAEGSGSAVHALAPASASGTHPARLAASAALASGSKSHGLCWNHARGHSSKPYCAPVSALPVMSTPALCTGRAGVS